MGDVIGVPRWGKINRSSSNLETKLASLNKFIRTKIIPPQVGSALFNFAGGKVVMTGDETLISGLECEAHISGDIVTLTGSRDHALDMFCSINREIEELISLGISKASG